MSNSIEKCQFILIQIQIKSSLQKFAHYMTAMLYLPCHVEKCCDYESEMKYRAWISHAIEFELWVISEMGTWCTVAQCSWWRHQMGTFPASLAICVGNSPVTGEFPAQRPMTRSFAVFFDLRLNKRLSKQWCGWWFETPSRLLWRHCNVMSAYFSVMMRHYSVATCVPWRTKSPTTRLFNRLFRLMKKETSSASLAICEGEPPVVSPHKGPVVMMELHFGIDNRQLSSNSLWPSDAIWRPGSRSTLVQVIACCLTAPSHYLINVDLSSLGSSNVHLRAISLEIS